MSILSYSNGICRPDFKAKSIQDSGAWQKCYRYGNVFNRCVIIDQQLSLSMLFSLKSMQTTLTLLLNTLPYGNFSSKLVVGSIQLCMYGGIV